MKRRTRPVSACENCRKKKVKCILKPDEPVCQNCSSAGKECLFRIDDLSPALRLERFADYGPPSENARQIASSTSKASHTSPSSSSSKLSRDRTSSLVEERSLERNNSEGSDKKRRRLSNDSRGIVGKSKAVFRSFANPTKLGAPSRSNAPKNAAMTQEVKEHPSRRSQEYPHSPRYGPQVSSQQQTYGNLTQSVPFDPANTPQTQQYAYSYLPTGYYDQAATSVQAPPPPPPHLQSSPSVSTFHDHEATWQYSHPTPQNYSYSPNNDGNHFRTSHIQSHERGDQRRLSATSSNSHTALPSFRSAFSSVDLRLKENTPDRARQQESTLASQSPNNSNRYRALMSPKGPREGVEFAHMDSGGGAGSSSSRSGMTLAPSVSWTDGYGPDIRQAASSHARQAPMTQQSRDGRTKSSSNSIVRQPAITPRSGLTPFAEAEMDVPIGKEQQQQQQQIQAASPAIVPSRNDLAASNEGLGAEPDGMHDGGREKVEASGVSQGPGSVAETTSSSNRPPPTFKKIALPFFRWFGATANTPGIRRIKVGVYHETDLEEEQGVDIVGQDSSMPRDGQEEVDFKSPGLVSDATPSNGVDGHAMTPREAAAKATPKLSHHGGESALSTSSRDLFESERPRYPRRDILSHLVNLFIKYFKASCFPWLDEVELIAGAQSGELPAILANSICAVTARFSNHIDLRRGPVKSAGEPFADMAKVLIVPMLSWPSVDVIEALVIISYSEFAAGADAGLWMYIGMALRMATDLGLQHEVTIKSMANKKQQDRARLLFWAIVCLDRITCFGTGRPVTVREDSFDCQLPPLGEEPCSDGFVFGHIVRTLLKRGRIGELLNRRTDDLSLEARGRRLRTMWLDLAEYYDSLPPTLHFGVNTFRKLAAANQGAAFVYLHVLLQSTMSLLNRPSLLRRFDKDFSISAPTKLASIANHASGTIVSILRFAEDARQERNTSHDSKDENPMVNPYIDCNPYLDQLILPAGRAFLTEREAVRDALRRLGYAAQSRPVSRGGSGTANGNESSGEKGNNNDAVTSAMTGAVGGGSVTTVAGSSSSTGADGPFNGLIASRQYAQTNLATCQTMLDRLALLWSGASWPARALRQETAGATGSDVEPDGNDEDAQPAPIRDVEMVLKWAKARVKRIRAYQKTPAASRRASMDTSGAVGGGTVFGGTSGGGLLVGQQDNNHLDVQSDDLNSLLRGQYIPGDSNTSGDSPLGLGFSGSFGTTSDIDIQALINAWANEENFIDSTQQQQGHIDLTTRPQDWSAVNHSGQTYASIQSLSAEAPPPPPQHQNNHQFGLSSSSLPSVLVQHTHTQTPNMVDLDLNAMQLEEFFFKSELGGNHQVDEHLQDQHGTQNQSLKSGGGGGGGGGSDDSAAAPASSSLDLPMEDFGGVNGLDDLPSALFNAFNYHVGAPALDYYGQQASKK